MSTEPFSPASDAAPADGTAAITPVTPEMMDHAAHKAAEKADAVAHEVAETHREVPEPEPIRYDATADPTDEQAVVEPPTVANENAAIASEAVEAAASDTLRAADLAFTSETQAAERTLDKAARSASASIDSLGLLNAKVMEIAASNLAAAGAFMSALLGAGSVPEAAAINADHMRRRLDALTTQGRELMLLAQKAAFDAMQPPGDGSREP